MAETPANNLFQHTCIQYRPTPVKDAKGGWQYIYNPAIPYIQSGDASNGSFRCMVQVFGHEKADLAGGHIIEDRWDFWCNPRDIRQGDILRIASGTGFSSTFYIRVEDFSAYPTIGNIGLFVRCFCKATAPPDGFNLPAGGG